MGPNDLWYIISTLKIPQIPSQSFSLFPPREKKIRLEKIETNPYAHFH